MDIERLAEALGIDTTIDLDEFNWLRAQNEDWSIWKTKDFILEERILERIKELVMLLDNK